MRRFGLALADSSLNPGPPGAGAFAEPDDGPAARRMRPLEGSRAREFPHRRPLSHHRALPLSARGLRAGLLAACAALFAAIAQAQVDVPSDWELKPSGLQVGDEFRLLLRTKNPHHATSTDIAVYDAHVQSQVARWGHGALKEYSAQFKILGSTATVDARAHNGMSGNGGVPVYWVNGARVADDNDDFFDGSWTSKTSGRGADGRLLGRGASNQTLCTGSADNGTATNLPLGGGDPDGNGNPECTATSVNTSSSTLGGRTLEVDARTRYLALSGVLRVADSTRPRVESVAITSNPGSDGEYVTNDTVAITVSFSEAVTVTGTPAIRIKLDSGGRRATYAAMPSTSTELVFHYTVNGKDYDHDGIGVRANGIVLPTSASITNQAGDADAFLAHEAMSNTARHKIHVKPRPVASGTRVASTPSANGNYTTGETITIEVAFDRNVQVHAPADSEMGTGIPSYELRFGVPYDTTGHHARYARVVDGSKVQFDYVVQAGDFDPDGILSHDPGIHWNGGAIMHAEMNAGILTDGVGNDSAQLTDVRAFVGRTVMLVQRDHTVNKVATDIELSTNPEVADEDAGLLSFTVTATLSGPPLTADTPVTVSVGDTGDTATEGTDYSTVDDFVLTITAGETSGTATFSLTLTDDEIIEGDEALSVTGTTTATGLSVTGTTATIVDNDDGRVTVSVSTLSVFEGSDATYTVVLGSEPTATVTVTPSVIGSPDVTVSPSSLSFGTSDWHTPQTVTVSAARDDDAQDDTATVDHAVSGGNYASVTAPGVTVTVKDNEVTLSVSASSVGEAAGATSITVTGTLNGLPLTTDTPVAVSVGATGDTATEGTDYSTVDDFVLTITAGQTSGVASFSLTPTNDATDEVNETISVTGSTTAPGLTVVGTTVSIIDDDRRGASVSIAGAEADEDDGQIVFTVSLSRPVRKIVSVDFETISGGTATENVDYRPQTTELMIFPGATSVQAGVSLIDDAIDDDGETVMVRIDNARVMGTGGTVVRTLSVTTATATGTIRNNDPMPGAWITRFGRTVGSQVVDALGERLEGGTGSHVTVGGASLGEGAYVIDETVEGRHLGLLDKDERTKLDTETWSMSAEEVLLGSAFHLSSGANQPGQAAFTAWGRVSMGAFEGEERDVALDGNVTTGLLGADAEWDRILAGVMVSQSRGDGAYHLDPATGDDEGTVESTMTGVYPYAEFQLNERVSAWGVVGRGRGELTIRRESEALETSLGMRMGALGLRGQVLDGSGASGVGLNVRSDAMWVRIESERDEGIMSAHGEVSRLRLILEAERQMQTAGGGTFVPTGEIGVRVDGGDAETGAGLELGAGMRYARGALSIEGHVRALVAHEESGYEEWGAGGTVRVSPGASGRGLTLSLAPVWGSAGSEAEQLWGTADASGLGTGQEFEATGRLEAELGYGIAVPRTRGVVTPYAGLSFIEDGQRTVRTGARWNLAPEAAMRLEGTWREGADGVAATSAVELRTELRW